jgi:acetyl-CoA carboxylase biotin carboxyl carrier protein
MDLDLEELAAIIELLDKTEFTDFRFEKGDLRIAVRRGGLLPDDAGAVQAEAREVQATPAPVHQAAAPATTASPATPAPAPAAVATPAAAGAYAAAAAAEDDGQIVVTSPMLGVFYRAPKPGEPPFVMLGDKVDADSVLCIVEVMKLMNSVRAGVCGEVTAIFADDGDMVEFGQPLFAIRTMA